MEKQELENKIKILREELGKYNFQLNNIKIEEEKNRQKSKLELLAEDNSPIKFTITIGEHFFLFVGTVKKSIDRILFEGLSVSYNSEYDDNGENIEYQFDQLRLEYISDLQERLDNTENKDFKIIKSYSEVFSHFKHYISQIKSIVK